MRWHWGRAEGGRLDLDPTNIVSRARAKTFGVLPAAAASPPRPRSAKKASSSGGSANMLEGFPSNPCVVRRFALGTPNVGPKGIKSNSGMRIGGCSARGVRAATNGYTHGRRVGTLLCSSSPPSPSIARSANGAQCKESSAQPRACPARGGPVRGPARVSDRSGGGSRCLALCIGREGAAPATFICQCPRSSGRPAAPFARRRCYASAHIPRATTMPNTRGSHTQNLFHRTRRRETAATIESHPFDTTGPPPRRRSMSL